MLMPLRPDESELFGLTADGERDIATQTRIESLTRDQLVQLADTDGGWSVLYRDPQDERLWELTYPQSEMHGGGPARLAVVSRDEVASRYKIPRHHA